MKISAAKIICALLLSIIFSFLDVRAEVLVGKVVGVTDGDTITVIDAENAEHKVRLMGIDAPEKTQDFGIQAKRVLSNLIYQKPVAVEYKKQDRYKRKVGKVILNNQDICLQMIQDGWAWHYKDYEKEQSKSDRDLYSQAAQSSLVNLGTSRFFVVRNKLKLLI